MKKKPNSAPASIPETTSTIAGLILDNIRKTDPHIADLAKNFSKLYIDLNHLKQTKELSDKQFADFLALFDKIYDNLNEVTDSKKFSIFCVNTVLKKFSWKGFTTPPNQLKIIRDKIFNDIYYFYMHLGDSIFEVRAQRNFFEKISLFIPNERPFYISVLVQQKAKHTFSIIVVANELLGIEKALIILDDLINSCEDKTVRYESLNLLIDYYDKLCQEKSLPAVKKLEKYVKLLKKIEPLTDRDHYRLGYAYDSLVANKRDELKRRALFHFKKALDLDIKLTHGPVLIDMAALAVGNYFYTGIENYIKSDHKKAILYLSKASATTENGIKARNLLLTLEQLSELLRPVVPEEKFDKMKKWVNRWEGSFTGAYINSKSMKFDNIEEYLSKIEERMATMQKIAEIDPMHYEEVAENCLLIYLFDAQKYPQAEEFYCKYLEAALDAQTKLTAAGKTFKSLSTFNPNRDINYHVELMQLIRNYQKSDNQRTEVSKISIEAKSRGIKILNPNYSRVFLICEQLAALNLSIVDFRYDLRKYLPQLNNLLQDISHFSSEILKKYLGSELGLLFVIDLCNLSISAQQKNLNKLLTNLIITFIPEVLKNFDGLDEAFCSMLVTILYKLATIGYPCDFRLLSMVKSNWIKLDTAHKFLLFYSLFLYHVESRENTACNGEAILKEVSFFAKKIEESSWDDSIKKESIYSMQVARAFAYFSSLKSSGITHSAVPRIQTLWQSLQEMGVQYKLDPHESKMQRLVMKRIQAFYSGNISKEIEIKNSTVQADLVLEEEKLIIHVDGLTHFNFLLNEDKAESGNLVTTPKTKGRNFICDQRGRKQVIINSDEVHACESGKEAAFILWFALLKKKFEPVFKLNLTHFKPKKLVGQSQRLVTSADSKAKGLKTIPFDDKIAQLLEQVNTSTAPDIQRQAYLVFYTEAVRSKNKEALQYLFARLEACLINYPIKTSKSEDMERLSVSSK